MSQELDRHRGRVVVGDVAAARRTQGLPRERRTRWTPWHVLAAVLGLAALAVLLALIYRLTDAGAGGVTPSQVAVGPTSPASASPAEAIGSGPAATAPVPTASASQTEDPATATAPPAILSADEELLVNGLREDAQLNCSPRREGLPEGARVGVECGPERPVTARVGVYLFDESSDSVTAYFRRLAAYGVKPETGSCSDGVPGDAAWLAVDEEVQFNGAMYSIFREGCFTDEYGQANVRMTGLGGPVYIGIVSEQTDIPALLDWAWSGAEFEGGPGIYSFPCADTGTEC